MTQLCAATDYLQNQNETNIEHAVRVAVKYMITILDRKRATQVQQNVLATKRYVLLHPAHPIPITSNPSIRKQFVVLLKMQRNVLQCSVVQCIDCSRKQGH